MPASNIGARDIVHDKQTQTRNDVQSYQMLLFRDGRSFVVGRGERVDVSSRKFGHRAGPNPGD
jgi:hypothetical protein